MDIRRFFSSEIPAHLAAAPEQFRRDACYLFRFTDGQEWTLDLRSVLPSCKAGGSRAANCTIEVHPERFSQALQNSAALLDLHYMQQMRIRGDFSKAADLPGIFELMTVHRPQIGGLAALLTPFSVTKFLSEYWPHRPLVVHGDPARLKDIADLPELKEVDSLLASWKETVTVFPPWSGDEYDAPAVLADVARQAFDKGLALSLANLEAEIPVLKSYLERLQVELALPANVFGRCLCYATPAGAGAAPHFDHNVNFVVQLTGDKVWHLAPNDNVVNPTKRYVMNSSGIHPELLPQVEGELPKEMPAGSRSIRFQLRPGSVLFVPRGWWHTTTASASSLSLNFTFSQPCWADVMGDAVRRLLIEIPTWRELATGVSTAANEPTKEAARVHLASLLQRLASDLIGLTPDDVIRAVRPPMRATRAKVDPSKDWITILTTRNTTPV